MPRRCLAQAIIYEKAATAVAEPSQKREHEENE
jgi:hypothetical protein